MARRIDNEKMEKIKAAAVALIISKGYGGASVAAIAKQAGVAEGYLYREYKSKQELVEDLLRAKVKDILNHISHSVQHSNGINEAVEMLVTEFFQIARVHPLYMKFVYVLMHDYNFQISREEQNAIQAICNTISEKGKERGELDPDLTNEELFSMLVNYPIEFINMRFKGAFGNTELSDADLNRVTQFVINAIQS